MPFKSKAQMRWMFAAEERGEIPKGTARRWAEHTPNIKSLPERVSKKKQTKKGMVKDAFFSFWKWLFPAFSRSGSITREEFLHIMKLLQDARKMNALDNLRWGLVGASLGSGFGYYLGDLAAKPTLLAYVSPEARREKLRDPLTILGGTMGSGIAALTSRSIPGLLLGAVLGSLTGRYVLPTTVK